MKRAGLTLNNICVGYGSRTLVRGLDIALPMGQLTAVVGRNGTGKSTLLRALAALSKPLSGKVLSGDTPISTFSPHELALTIGFVSTERIRVPNLKVRDVVSLGRTPHTNWIGKLSAEDETAVWESLAQVGMSDFAVKQMDTLSDGEAQRVMIARVLAQDTPIILLDEPTAFLDLPNRYEICLLLRRLAHEQAKTVIFSSHDLSIVMELADNILILDLEKWHFGSPQQLLASGSLSQIFKGSAIELGSKGQILYPVTDSGRQQ